MTSYKWMGNGGKNNDGCRTMTLPSFWKAGWQTQDSINDYPLEINLLFIIPMAQVLMAQVPRAQVR
jgi:hypothetical protein